MRAPLLCILIAGLVLAACSGSKNLYSPDKKYSAQQLREDFLVLRTIFEKNHPSLYWYTPKDSVDYFFNTTYNSLSDSLTEPQFRNRLSSAIATIRCGHTAVRSSKQAFKWAEKATRPQFPLLLKVWKDTAVVIGNLLQSDSLLPRGTQIESINNIPMRFITDSICKVISADGYSDIFRYQLITTNFPAFYRSCFGSDSSYKVTYIDTLGQKGQLMLKSYQPGKPGKPEKISRSELPPTRHELKQEQMKSMRSLRIDTALNAAYLSINTFNEGKLRRFYKRSFREIKEKHVQNLVLDLRLNTGGSVLSCTRLSQYLIDKPFKVADTVAAISRKLEGKKFIKPWFTYWLSMHVSGRKNIADNKIHFRYFERHVFKPEQKWHYDGQVYVLTGGYTFSAATLVTDALKGQHNVAIVGEETGGGAYGNSSMFLTNITLPNTRLRVVLPLYRIVLHRGAAKTGRGIVPDVLVSPSVEAIKNGRDAKMDAVEKLLLEQTK